MTKHKTPTPVPKPNVTEDGIGWCDIACPYYESRWVAVDEEQHVCKAQDSPCLPDDGVCLEWARDAARSVRAWSAMRCGIVTRLFCEGEFEWYAGDLEVRADDPITAVLKAAEVEL